jgi:hypothetical protein
MINLRFVGGYGLSSGAIKLFSAGPFSHVDARVPVGGVALAPLWPAGSLVGARSDKIGGKPPGLQCRPFGYEKVKVAVEFHLPATVEQEQAFWASLYSEEADKYDSKGIIAFAFNVNWHSPGEFFCSAAIGNGLESADWMAPTYSPYSKIPPVALANLVSSRAGVTWEDSPSAKVG